jgi:hypothetical protein
MCTGACECAVADVRHVGGRGLGCAWQEVQRADARPRLVARCAVTAERAAAHSAQRAPEMRLEPRIAPGGGRGGRWRRSARGRSRLGCGVEDAAMGRHSAAAGGSPCGLNSCPRCSPACDAVPPCAGLCAMSVLRPCHSRTRRPARSTHHALLEAHASTSRPCTARRRLVEAPALSDRYPSLSIKIALIAPRAPARNLLTPRGGLETAFQEK